MLAALYECILLCGRCLGQVRYLLLQTIKYPYRLQCSLNLSLQILIQLSRFSKSFRFIAFKRCDRSMGFVCST